MSNPRVLYISGSFGLGHVTRDLAIARQIRRLCPDAEIRWLAASPASDVLTAAGEKLVPEHAEYRSETELADMAGASGQLSITKYAFRAGAAYMHNARVIGRAATQGGFDLIVGDETYEVPIAELSGIHVLHGIPYVMVYDSCGLEVTSRSMSERLGAWVLNLSMMQFWRVTERGRNAAVFIGELEDVPDRRYGFLLPNRRRHIADHLEFVGYVLPFDVDGVPAREVLRRKLGYGDERLVICTIGGLSIGRPLLELCGRAFPLAAARIPGLRMVLVAGPRVDPNSLDAPEGVERRGMVPELWRHLAACDLAVVQAGGTTTLELEALRVPFLYFPIEHQSEQEVTVAGRLARHRAGVRMRLSGTTPENLADAIVANLGAKVSYASIPASGARRIAERVLERAGCL